MNRSRVDSPHIDVADGAAAVDAPPHTPAAAVDMTMIAASTASHGVNEMTNVTGAAMEIDEVNDAPKGVLTCDPSDLSSSTDRQIARHDRGIDNNHTAACYFDLLATVEVQSIMQMMDRKSLLALARCSKRMMADGDSDVAWRYTDPFELVIDEWAGLVTLADGIRSSRLVSHMPLIIWIDPVSESDSESDLEVDQHTIPVAHQSDTISRFPPDACIDRLLTIPHIISLNIYCQLNQEQWRRVLTSRAIINLIQLRVGSHGTERPLPRGFLSHLVRLTHLTHLELLDPLIYGEDVSLLSQLPLLSSLSLNDSSRLSDGGDSFVPSVAHCRHLTDLTLRQLSASGTQFRALFTSPNIVATLKRLTINNFSPHGPPEEDHFYQNLAPIINHITKDDYIVSFKALTHLESLTLTAFDDVDRLVPHVPHLMSLVELNLIGGCSVDVLRRLFLLPPPASEGDRRRHPTHGDASAASGIDQSRVESSHMHVDVSGSGSGSTAVSSTGTGTGPAAVAIDIVAQLKVIMNNRFTINVISMLTEDEERAQQFKAIEQATPRFKIHTCQIVDD